MPSEEIKIEKYKYIDIVDRYLEVAFVYHEKMKANKAIVDNDRIKRVINSLESLTFTNGNTVKIITEAKGQNIAPDKTLVNLTKIYQKIILERLQRPNYSAFQPRNVDAIKDLMGMAPEVYLGAFGSTSYAWDVLNEAASICFLPGMSQLERRDLICMHSLELRQHLSRVLAQEMIHKPSSVLPLQGEISVEKLQHIRKAEDLIGIIVSRPSFWNNDFHKLSDQVKEHFTDEAKTLFDEIHLKDVEEAIYPYMDENLDFSKVTDEKVLGNISKKMVVYGLSIAYLAWISACEITNDRNDTELLARHMLFTTRMLLDEQYWFVCQFVAELAYKYRELINKKTGNPNIKDKTYMLFANKVFAEKMVKGKITKKIKEEVEAWDVNEAHIRYVFLKHILLEEYKTAFNVGKELIEIDDNNQMNITSKELKTWPILADFCSSDEGKELILMAEDREQELLKN